MEKIKNNWGYIVSIILLIIFFVYIIFDYNKRKNSIQEYSKNIFYLDTYINVKIFDNDRKSAENALTEVEKIYSKYHKLTDRYNAYDGITNVYTINNNNLEISELTIDKELYDLISFGIDCYDKTNGLININIGEVVDIWKKYRDSKNGIHTIDELKSADINIDNIVLLSDNKIANNNSNIDLGAIAKGYVTEIAGDYLESIGFDKYIINAGGNVLVGSHYKDGLYNIGIENPNNNSDIYKIITGNNITLTTSGNYQRYYEYEGVKYHHIINPNTLYPSNYMKSVTVINKSGKLGDMLSTALFMMSIEDGRKLLENYPDTEVIWYTIDDLIIKSKGFSKYEQD